MTNPNNVIRNILGTPKRGGRRDLDGDGVPNRKDCQPRNTMRQDVNKGYWDRGTKSEFARFNNYSAKDLQTGAKSEAVSFAKAAINEGHRTDTSLLKRIESLFHERGMYTGEYTRSGNPTRSMSSVIKNLSKYGLKEARRQGW